MAELIYTLLRPLSLLCKGPNLAGQASDFATPGSGLAAASQHAVQHGHIAPAVRAGTIQAWRVEQGRKSPAWNQRGGNMDHTEQAGVKSHKNHEPVCVQGVHVCVMEDKRES